MASSTDVRILGPLEVEDGDRAIDLGAPKQRAVFAILVLNANSIVSSDRIIDGVWADAAPRTAGHSVQIYVSELRKALDSTEIWIETRPPGYILRAPREAVDAHRFEDGILAGLKEANPDKASESLLGAMQLWRGDPLVEFAYDDFAQDSVRRLHELHARAAERLAELNLESGHPQVALSWLDRGGIERLREKGQLLRMLALYRSGRQVDALRSFADYKQGLVEVGLTPPQQLLDLEGMIINRDEALGLRPGKGPNPYKGLRAFTSEDSGHMFGRDALTSEITRRLRSGHGLVAVVGPSGSGKSSVVRAAVAPALESELWTVVTMTPGEDPVHRLDRVLDDTQGPRLVIVDQFEEAFTICEPQESARFLTRLADLAAESLTSVLVAIRADHFDAPLRLSHFSKLFAAGVVPVLPMSEAELREAISRPAEVAGLAIEPALVERLIADMEDQPGALPLMQFTLTELFDSTTSDAMSLEGYLQLGGLKGALAKRADQIHDSLGLSDRASLRRLLLNLTYATKAGIRRRSVPLGDLLGSERPEIERLIETLTVHRLVSRDRDPVTGEATVEIAHEALLEEWERLRRWITTYRADLERREALTLRAMDWEESGQDPAYLLGGSALSLYETWARNSEIHLSDLATAYLAESSEVRAQLGAKAEAEAEERRRMGRRARRRLVAIGGLVAVVAAAGTYGLRSTIAGVFSPPPEVVHIMNAGVATDASFNETAHAGFLQGLDETGLRGEVGIVIPGTEPQAVLDAQAARGVGLIVVEGFWLTDDVARAHPNTHFAVWDIAGDLPNVTYNNFKEQEGSFLVGAAAALTTETGAIGFLGGVDLPIIGKFEAGYTAGARAVNPDVTVEVRYLTDWYDLTGFQTPSRARQAATEMYQAGVDVIFHAAGLSGLGLFEAAAEQSNILGRHVWAIGVDGDQYVSVDDVDGYGPWDPEEWKPHILTSMLKRLDTVAVISLKDYAAGRLESGIRNLGLAEGGVDYSRSGGFVEGIVLQLEALRRDIISGRIVVPSVPEGRIYDLPG